MYGCFGGLASHFIHKHTCMHIHTYHDTYTASLQESQLKKRLISSLDQLTTELSELKRELAIVYDKYTRSLRAQTDLTNRNAEVTRELTEFMNRTLVERQDMQQQLETLLAENEELQHELQLLQPIDANSSPSNSPNSSR